MGLSGRTRAVPQSHLFIYVDRPCLQGRARRPERLCNNVTNIPMPMHAHADAPHLTPYMHKAGIIFGHGETASPSMPAEAQIPSAIAILLLNVAHRRISGRASGLDLPMLFARPRLGAQGRARRVARPTLFRIGELLSLSHPIHTHSSIHPSLIPRNLGKSVCFLPLALRHHMM